MALYRIGHAPVDTGTHGAVVAAKLGDDGLLPLLHNEKTGAQPNQERNASHDAQTPASVFKRALTSARGRVVA